MHIIFQQYKMLVNKNICYSLIWFTVYNKVEYMTCGIINNKMEIEQNSRKVTIYVMQKYFSVLS